MSTSKISVTCLSGIGLVFAGLAGALPAAATVAPVTCHGVPATIVGTDGSDHLVGTRHRDVIVALAGSPDVIKARGGNDLVCAGQGKDVVYGGSGNDVVYGDDNNTTAQYTNDRLYGGAGNDRLFGRAGADQLEGGAGNDVLRGGPDQYGPDSGRVVSGDSLAGGAGDDLLDVGQIGRRSSGGPLDSISFAHARHGVRVDLPGHLATGEGHDNLVTTDGLFVTGSSHADVMVGSGGDDELIGEAGGDRIAGRGGNDFVAAGSPDGAAPGPGAHDVITGGAGHDGLGFLGRTDVARGGAGLDNIILGPKVDGVRVDGGPGDDVLSYDVALTEQVGDLELLAGAGVVRQGSETGHWSGFSSVWVQARVNLTYVGTSASDDLLIDVANSVDARTKGGDDKVQVVNVRGSARLLTGAGDDDDDVEHARSLDADGGAGQDAIQSRVADSTCVNFEVSVGC